MSNAHIVYIETEHSCTEQPQVLFLSITVSGCTAVTAASAKTAETQLTLSDAFSFHTRKHQTCAKTTGFLPIQSLAEQNKKIK